MTQTLQLDEVQIIELHEAPRLLVEWSPRWESFVTSIGPAFSRSGPRLAGEAPHGKFPYRGMTASFLLQAFLLFVVLALPRQIAKLRPYAAPRLRPYEVIYYSGDELPRTQDLGGSQSGASGHAGGAEAHHRSQTIHVARGSSLAPKIVDAPNLKLPSSTDAVANLLAFKSDPGPRPISPAPPAEGLHSQLTALNLPVSVIAPAPSEIARDQSRNRVALNAVVPPAPNVSANNSRRTPALNAAIVPPAPSVNSDHRLVAPSLETRIIAPAPDVARDHTLTAPSFSANVVAPAPARISRDQTPSTPGLNGTVIPPAPAAVGREVSTSRVQMNNAAVVPPPASAPERDSARTAKLTMPAPAVIAPPPSADSTHDLHRLESGGTGATSPTVVPPPPSAGNTSIVSTIIGKLFGTQEVVPPPPAVTGTARSGGTGASLESNVIPPPPAVGAAGSGRANGSLSARVVPPPPSVGGTARGNGPSGALAANVIPPPPSVSGTAGSREGSGARTQHSPVGTANVIPPPPTVTDSVNGQGVQGTRRAADGTFLASNVVPPPPSAGSSSGISGSGRRGSGLGGPGDAGSVLAPPKAEEGNSDKSGVVISSQPGTKVGMTSGGKGSLAMSPGGGDKPGLGGSGGGTSIGHVDGPGSGLNRETSASNSGAGKIETGKTGSGVGSDPTARAGISPTPGPGGAGTSPTGAPAVPGVDVRGGSTSNIVNLPSFGDSGSAPNLPGRSSVKEQQGPAITIVATSRSGGAFDFYGKLPGDNYTVYVDTTIGTVVMQFAEVNPGAHPQAGALTGPQGLRNDLPADLPHARVVIKCKLDAYGNLKNLQVLEPGPAAMTAKIMAALPSWKFRPAMRGVQPVEVNAILGFNIDTNDRY